MTRTCNQTRWWRTNLDRFTADTKPGYEIVPRVRMEISLTFGKIPSMGQDRGWYTLLGKPKGMVAASEETQITYGETHPVSLSGVLV